MVIRVILSLLFIFQLASVSAQSLNEYKKFRVLLGIGYASGSGYSSAGILGTLEPGWRISPRITMSLRGEIAGIARGDYEGLSVNVDVSRINSLTANAIYYFGDDFIRPFAGFGLGSFTMSSIEYKLDGSGTNKGTGTDAQFGFYPRVGVEIGHIHFSIDWNIIPKTETDDGAQFKNSYLGIRLGVFFGGGPKPDTE